MPIGKFVVGDSYVDRKGDYIVLEVNGDSIKIQYLDGECAIGTVAIKARIHSNISAEVKTIHPVQTRGYFHTLGYLARYATLEAEVPAKAQAGFEDRYKDLSGHSAVPHVDGYYPLATHDPGSKWGPELRIYFPAPQFAAALPAGIEMRSTANPSVVRVSNNGWWWRLVAAGFRLGVAKHDVARIRSLVPPPFRQSFEDGITLKS